MIEHKVYVPLEGPTDLTQLLKSQRDLIVSYLLHANLATPTPQFSFEMAGGKVAIVVTPAEEGQADGIASALENGMANVYEPNLKAYAPGVITGVGTPYVKSPPVMCHITLKTEDGKTAETTLDIASATLGDLKAVAATHFGMTPKDQILGTPELGQIIEDDKADGRKALGDYRILVKADGKQGYRYYFSGSEASVGVLVGTPPAKQTPTPPPDGLKVCLYYSSWSVYRHFYLPAIDFSKITHLIYAFADIAPDSVHPDPNGKAGDGEVYMPDPVDIEANFAALEDIRQKFPHLKTILSVGGWTYSYNFSHMAADPARRARFIDSFYKIAADHGFDGLDIDWEFPVEGGKDENFVAARGFSKHGGPVDKENFATLLEELRGKVNKAKAAGGSGKVPELITIAVSPRPRYHDHLDLDRICRSVDWINIMAYDYFGSFPGAKTTNFNAPLYPNPSDPTDLGIKHDFNIDATVRSLLTRDVDPKKLVLGLSFYGRGFYDVDPGPANDGMYQAFKGPITGGTWPGAKRPDGTYPPSGVYDYWDLFENYIASGLNPDPTHKGWEAHYDYQSQGAWLYSPGERILIAYDDPQTIWNKCAYIAGYGLGGAMIWEASNDRYNQLLYVVNRALQGDGLKASGKLLPTALPGGVTSPTAWSEAANFQASASGLSGLSFMFDDEGIHAIRGHYGAAQGDWQGRQKGQLVHLEIPAERYISRMDFHTAGTPATFSGLGISFDNRTYFSIGETDETDHLTSVGAESTRLNYLRGTTGLDASGQPKLLQVACEFNGIPPRKAAPLYPLAGLTPEELAGTAVATRLAKGYCYVGTFDGGLERKASAQAGAPEQPQIAVTAGASDTKITAAKPAEGGINFEYKLAFHALPEKAALKVGDPEDPLVELDFKGPSFGPGDNGTAFSKSRLKIKYKLAGQGVDWDVGKGGLTVDTHYFDILSEDFEVDKDHVKVGYDDKGIEINKKGVGFYIGLGKGFELKITLINFAALAGFAGYYIAIGRALFRASAKVFSRFYHVMGAIVGGLKSIFSHLF